MLGTFENFLENQRPQNIVKKFGKDAKSPEILPISGQIVGAGCETRTRDLMITNQLRVLFAPFCFFSYCAELRVIDTTETDENH